MTATAISAKFFNEKIKRGWDAKHFAEHLGLTEEKFLESLKKNFSGKALENMLRQLEKNRCQNAKHMKPRTRRKVVTVQKPEPQELTLYEEQEDLESLEEKLQSLTEKICKMEVEHKELLEERRIIEKQLSAASDILERIKKQLVETRDQVVQLDTMWISSNNKLLESRKQIAEQKDLLFDIQQRVLQKKKVQILFYLNGEVEVEENPVGATLQFSEEEAKSLAQSFMEEEAFQDLSLREIKSVAKAKVIADVIRSQELICEMVFESEEAQKVFDDLE